MLDKSALSELKALKKQLHDATPRSKGTVKGTSKRYGFVVDEKDGQQYLLTQSEMDKLLPGDNIQFTLEPGQNKDDKPIAKIEKWLGSNFQYFVGEVKLKNKQYYVIPDHPQCRRWFFIPPKFRKDLVEGDLVCAEVSQHPFKSDGRSQAKIIGLIGKPDSPFIDHKYALAKHNLHEKAWKQEELEAIRLHAEQLLSDEIPKRKSFTDVPFCTIDGQTTQDLDDAVYAEKQGDIIKLWVAIADASFFVSPGSPLDKIAKNLGSSVYLPGQKISMLPDVLSADVCSLKANIERLAIINEMHFDENGNIIHNEYHQAVINSNAKLSYEQVNLVATDEDHDVAPELVNSLKALKELTLIRSEWRKQNAFQTEPYPDYRLNLDENGKISSIEKMERLFSQQMIEEAMLSCNQSTADFMAKHFDNALYWVNKGFKKDQLPGVKRLLAANLPAFQDKDTEELANFVELIHTAENTDSGLPLKDILKKKMARSEWSMEPGPHFGLGIPCYTTFTSPIRKYSDITTHRLIKSYLNNESCSSISNELIEQLNSTSTTIRSAQRDCELTLKAEFISGSIGETFSGPISMINHRLIGVYLEDFDIHGQIEVKSLNQAFKFIQESLELTSEAYHFKLGDEVKVKLVSVDIKEKQIRLELLQND